MTHRGEPKKRFSFKGKKKKKKENVYVNLCLACDLLNSAGKTGGHPRKGHTDEDTGRRCECWCNR